MNIVLSVGKEWRRGHGRLQGFYGADAYLMFGSSSTKYTYGNDYTTLFTSANSTSWTNASGTAPVVGAVGSLMSRPTKESFGSTFGIGCSWIYRSRIFCTS